MKTKSKIPVVAVTAMTTLQPLVKLRRSHATGLARHRKKITTANQVHKTVRYALSKQQGGLHNYVVPP
jgi:predicted transcriptional regulator